MNISVSTKREFIPEFNGNRKLTGSDQLKVTHRAPTIAIKERLFPRKFVYGANGEITGTFEIDRKRIISELTIDFVNFDYSLDGEDKKITTVEQLFKAPVEFDPLIEELYTYYNNILNVKANEKN